MSVLFWRAGALALALPLLFLVFPADAQYYRPGTRQPLTVNQQSFRNLSTANVNPNPYIAPGLTLGQYSYNTAVLGRAYSQVPPYALGYNPYVNRANYNVVTPSVGYGGYGGYGYGAPYGGYMSGHAGSLYGLAALTQASGQYQMDIQQAKLGREQARQASLETKRKQMEWEIEYEKMRPTAITMRDKERAVELNWARNSPPSMEIWSGRALNVLLRSIADKGNHGPSIPLSEPMLQHLNIKSKSQRGNIGLIKSSTKLRWPTGLQDERFDDTRDRFTKNFQDVAEQLTRSGGSPNIKTLRSLKADLGELNSKLDDAVATLSPSEWIVARRYLTQLKGTITALNEPTVGAALDRSWVSKVHNCGELVALMLSSDFEFGAAVTPNEQTAASALYYPFRAYEVACSQMSSPPKSSVPSTP